jgi:hypothetical protein
VALLGVQQITQAGVAVTTQAAAAGGDTVQPGDSTWIEVTNAGGGSINVTVDSVVPSNYGTDVDLVVAVPAGQSRRIGPLGPARFANPTTGLVNVTYSGVASVTVAAVKI